MGIQLMMMFSSRKLQSIIRDEKALDYTVQKIIALLTKEADEAFQNLGIDREVQLPANLRSVELLTALF